MATAMLCAVVIESGEGRNSNDGWMIDASAGSPIHPRPRLAMVMPSCVAAMYRSGWLTARWTARARRRPSVTSWSMRVLRTVTMENSAATKNPLASTSARTPARRHRMPASECSIRVLRGSGESNQMSLGFAIREEMRVDERVDDGLVGGIDRVELDAHAEAPIVPR